jgi:serine/threonine protein phosphatase 1
MNWVKELMKYSEEMNNEDNKPVARQFVVGDLHGNYKGFKQCLEKINFDYDNDLLISIGDIADGYSGVPEIIEEVMKMKNFIWVIGNHDEWVQKWMSGFYNMMFVGEKGEFDHPMLNMDTHMWLSQGGKATYRAYVENAGLMSVHRDFWLNKPKLYHVLHDELAHESYCFVHAGFSPSEKIADLAKRAPNFWMKAMSCKGGIKLNLEDDFAHVFIGHTSTNFWNKMEPMTSGGVTNVDTGAGWHGKVTIMNINTREFVQSEEAVALYPNEKPRR